jgi:hypothetical protein
MQPTIHVRMLIMLYKIKIYFFLIHIIGANVMLAASQIRRIIARESPCM